MECLNVAIFLFGSIAILITNFIIDLTSEWNFINTLAFIFFAPRLQEKSETLTVNFTGRRKPSFKIPSPPS
jgi:hypothetical protein